MHFTLILEMPTLFCFFDRNKILLLFLRLSIKLARQIYTKQVLSKLTEDHGRKPWVFIRKSKQDDVMGGQNKKQ